MFLVGGIPTIAQTKTINHNGKMKDSNQDKSEI
jgi:hypothetical protein